MTKDTMIQGKYELQRRLRNGGMGALWTAFDRVLCRPVAVKFLAEGAADAANSRFAKEARFAARIASPHVIQTFDFGFEGKTPFIVMELLQGQDLRERLTQGAALSHDQILALFEQILKGLEAIHAAGIIHRDIKPGNVFLAKIGDQEVVKLIDFGIAKDPQGPRETWAGQILGTPRYMSPEQVAASGDVDARSDLWSVGIMLFRALTGSHAFPAEGTSAILLSICNDAIPAPSKLATGVPASIDALVARFLERAPADRFPTARQALAAVEAVRFELRRASMASIPEISSVRPIASETDTDKDWIELGTSDVTPDAPPVSAMPFDLLRRKGDSSSGIHMQNSEPRFGQPVFRSSSETHGTTSQSSATLRRTRGAWSLPPAAAPRATPARTTTRGGKGQSRRETTEGQAPKSWLRSIARRLSMSTLFGRADALAVAS